MNIRSSLILQKCCVAILGIVGLSSPAGAQMIFAPLTLTGPLPSRTVAVGKAAEPAAASSINSVLKSDLPLFQWGPIGVRPQFLYRYMDATGLELGPGEFTDSRVHTLLVGTTLDIGMHWKAEYSASRTLYSNEEFKDSWDHMADIGGSYALGEWALGLSGSYSLAHPLMAEVARQTTERAVRGGISLRRRIGERTAFDVNGQASYSRAEPTLPTPDWTTTNLHDWSSNAGLSYAFTQRTEASVRLNYIFANPSIGPSSTGIRPTVGLVWAPTDRLVFDANGGWERRRVHKPGVRTLTNPAYSGTARYRPFEVTTITLGASQQIERSYLVDALTKTRGWNAGIEQRLLQRLYVQVGYSDRNARYVGTEGSLAVVRKDTFRTVDARLSMPLQARAAVAVWYARTKNSSTVSGYTFTSRQIGAEVSIRF